VTSIESVQQFNPEELLKGEKKEYRNRKFCGHGELEI